MKKTYIMALVWCALYGGPAIIVPAAYAAAEAAVSGEEAASKLIENLGSETLAILKSNDPRDVKRQNFFKMFVKYFDVPRIAKHVMKKHWKKGTKEECQEYIKLFTQDVVNTYFNLLQQYYQGDKFSITRAEVSKDNPNSFMVASEIHRKNGQNISIKWRILNGKVLDAIIEKISTISNLEVDCNNRWRHSNREFSTFLKEYQGKVSKILITIPNN